MRICSGGISLLWVEILLQIHTKLFSKRFEVAKVLIVLAFVFDFGFDAFLERKGLAEIFT